MIARFQYQLVECTDANKNTPLSEAAAGGTLYSRDYMQLDIMYLSRKN